MKLIFLHGPPASGKYTLAKNLESMGFCRNFHNHLTLDVAKALFEFGSNPFWDLVEELRLVSIKAIAREGFEAIIFTYCYNQLNDFEFIQKIKKVVTSHGGEFIPVYLKCENEELERRVVSPHRKEMKKINDVESLREFRKSRNNIAHPDPNCFSLDTTLKSVNECVEEIISHCKLSKSK